MLSVASEKLIKEDAVHLLEAYKDAYTEVCQELQKPNVLITGITGSGKSSFINALFHDYIAPVGSGTPITQHFDRYAPAEIPIVLYDSKGLENGKADEFISSTKEFFKNHAKGTDGDLKNCVHVVWYICNSAMARFQDFEKHICTSLFSQVPIIFVLNKADLSTGEEREAIKDAITSMNLENFYGIYDTVCVPGQKQNTIDIDACPSCGAEDITISKRNKLMKCDSCGYTKSIIRRNGLSDVIKATLNLLPLLARDAFVASQKVSIHAKETQATAIFLEYSSIFEKVHNKSGLTKETAKLLTRLSIVWQFREHGQMYGVDVAKSLSDSLSFRDSVLLLVHQKTAPKYLALALALLWNRCVRILALELFKDTVEIQDEKDLHKLKSQWSTIVHNAFAPLTKENLEVAAKAIQKEGLKEVLAKEMPTDTDEDIDQLMRSSSTNLITGEKKALEHSKSVDGKNLKLSGSGLAKKKGSETRKKEGLKKSSTEPTGFSKERMSSSKESDLRKDKSKDKKSHKDLEEKEVDVRKDKSKDKKSHKDLEEKEVDVRKDKSKDKKSHKDLEEKEVDVRKESKNKDKKSHKDLEEKEVDIRKESKNKDNNNKKSNKDLEESKSKDRKSHKDLEEKEVDVRKESKSKERKSHKDLDDKEDGKKSKKKSKK